MPLLDHADLAARDRRPWEGFHSAWVNQIILALNPHLPPGFFLCPEHRAGSAIRADIAAVEQDIEGGIAWGGGVATAAATYAPPAAAFDEEADFGTLDVAELQVFNADGEQVLVGVIELVSPSNKDRPASREAFVAKCLGYLRETASASSSWMLSRSGTPTSTGKSPPRSR